MRRSQAIFVIIALLAAPLALLARGMGGDTSACNHMCCLRHDSHPTAGKTLGEGMMCHRTAASHGCECAMNSGRNSIDYGFLAPIVPTSASAIVSILNPQVSREYFGRPIEVAISGFLSAPFEPPRA